MILHSVTGTVNMLVVLLLALEQSVQYTKLDPSMGDLVNTPLVVVVGHIGQDMG